MIPGTRHRWRIRVLERSTDNHWTRRLLLVFLLTSLLAAGSMGTLAANASTYRSRLLSMVNQSRDRKGLDPVTLNVRLSADALHHSRFMVRRDRVFNTKDLAAVLKPYRWSYGGEAVACGSSLFQIHRDFMRDAVHRAILMSTEARRIGIGVVVTTGKTACGRGTNYWVTEILYG